MRNIALFDLDGTLADDTHRVHHVLAGDWAAYFTPDLMIQDSVLDGGRVIMSQYQDMGYEVAYLTARRHVTRDVTERWLDQHGFPLGRLTMKEWEETRPAANYKADYLDYLTRLDQVGDVVLFDDDPEVVRHVNETTSARAVQIQYYVKQTVMVKEPSV